MTCLTKIVYFYASGPKRIIYHTFTCGKRWKIGVIIGEQGRSNPKWHFRSWFPSSPWGQCKVHSSSENNFCLIHYFHAPIESKIESQRFQSEFRQIEFLSFEQNPTLDFQKPHRVYRWPHLCIFVRTPKSMWMWSKRYVDFHNFTSTTCNSDGFSSYYPTTLSTSLSTKLSTTLQNHQNAI